MLKKVISGGQTGADEAGLFAAKKYGLQTGGHVPKGFLTEKGSNTNLGTDYGLVETTTATYPPRTRLNAQNSDGTIRFAKNFNSAGEVCTLNAINEFNKPYINVHPNKPPTPEAIAQWIIDNNIETLNVAGNRESTAQGLFEYTVNFLTEVFQCLERLGKLSVLKN